MKNIQEIIILKLVAVILISDWLAINHRSNVLDWLTLLLHLSGAEQHSGWLFKMYTYFVIDYRCCRGTIHGLKFNRKFFFFLFFYWLKTPPAPAIALGARSIVSRLNGSRGPGRQLAWYRLHCSYLRWPEITPRSLTNRTSPAVAGACAGGLPPHHALSLLLRYHYSFAEVGDGSPCLLAPHHSLDKFQVVILVLYVRHYWHTYTSYWHRVLHASRDVVGYRSPGRQLAWYRAPLM